MCSQEIDRLAVIQTDRRASPSQGQQAFGRALLERHPFVVIPSTVIQESWNLLFSPTRAAGRYALESQKRFSLDTRLNPPAR
jgi:RES domain-containing protein